MEGGGGPKPLRVGLEVGMQQELLILKLQVFVMNLVNGAMNVSWTTMMKDMIMQTPNFIQCKKPYLGRPTTYHFWNNDLGGSNTNLTMSSLDAL